MNSYMVRIRRGTQTVSQFEALASDSCACVNEHADKCGEGEKLDVMSLEMWKRFDGGASNHTPMSLGLKSGTFTTKGPSHATKHDEQTEQINGRRRQQDSTAMVDATCIEISLTQQATNSTCVTARRDGQPDEAAAVAADLSERESRARHEQQQIALYQEMEQRQYSIRHGVTA